MMSGKSGENKFSRRHTITGIGLTGVTFAQYATNAEGQNTDGTAESVLHYQSLKVLREARDARPGYCARTLGFHSPGDGGAAVYQLRKPETGLSPNNADIIELKNGVLAVLKESNSLNYKMFGSLCDGEADDGVQIKLAHEYANRHQLPVINLTGEFWIKRTNGIPIATPLSWGKTIFHIDERHSDRRIPRFLVTNDHPAQDLTQDLALRETLIRKLKPGVQIIEELAPYAGRLMMVQDSNDRIGIRAGYEGNKGWAREELFYIEEEGRIIGDIAWEFKNLTSIRAIQCNDNYLVIQGGGFHFSGDTPEGGASGYYQNGIGIQRSRTIIREQWMGLEPGKRDRSLEARSGMYVLNGVYDVTLENIRAMPWEKDRRPPEKAVPQGTYGISGARMLNCTFRNLTAEGGWVAWGVFGTNLNKNFRLENCSLNRVDVHFHCWNLYLENCTIGLKGISVTGGGDLFLSDTTKHGNTFISFRPDYGARWNGPIRLSGCTLKPSGNGRVSVLNMRPSDFDYQYPIGYGTSVTIENLSIDYSATASSTEQCWLMDIAPFSRNKHGQRLLFPSRLTFRNIHVTGREQGIRLIRILDPYHYELRRNGGCDEMMMHPNCTLICDNVQLENTIPTHPGDLQQAHLVIGGENLDDYADQEALYPKIVFQDCENVSLYLGQCAASVFLQRCSVNMVTAINLRGELNFSDCHLQPNVSRAEDIFYSVESSLGTRFTNCTIHAPFVNGKLSPEGMNNIGFMEINKSLRYYHLNTTLGGEMMNHIRQSGAVLLPGFIGKLKAHHALEE